MLVAAMNPCPCGNYPDMQKCSCTPSQIQKYLGKISQPFLDRMDLCIETPKVEYQELDIERIGGIIGGNTKQSSRSKEITEKKIRGNANPNKLYAWTGRNQDLYSIRQCGKKVDGEGI